MEKVFFTILRLGLGNTTAEEENLSGLIELSVAQWSQIGEWAWEQGVLGVVLDGLDKLEATSNGLTMNLSAQQKLEWIGKVLQCYEAGNQKQLLVIDDLQKKWGNDGIRMMVLKGQAMGTYYPEPKHRCPGDIDCYLFDGYAKGNEIAKKWAYKVDEGWYKHSTICYKGETIENHQYFVHTREGKNSKRLNQLLVDTLKIDAFDRIPGTEALLPPPMFNAIFLTYHALAHFIEEGLVLKQILDWAMFLKRDAEKVDWKEFYRICDKFHFRRFADVMTTIAIHYLGVKLENTEITTTSPYTERVLQSTFNDKDYVFGSGEGEWTNRWHIVRNLFKYRWKYHKIYQHSILRQLWYYAIGYVFKTE